MCKTYSLTYFYCDYLQLSLIICQKKKKKIKFVDILYTVTYL